MAESVNGGTEPVPRTGGLPGPVPKGSGSEGVRCRAAGMRQGPGEASARTTAVSGGPTFEEGSAVTGGPDSAGGLPSLRGPASAGGPTDAGSPSLKGTPSAGTHPVRAASPLNSSMGPGPVG